MTPDFISWEAAVTWLVEQPDRAQLVRECYFDRPVHGAVTRYAGSEEWRELLRWMPERPGLALDVGAGNGLVSFALATSGWRVRALEPDPSGWVGAGAIRALAAEQDLPIEVVEEFGEALPFDDATFDLVMARQVLHHARDLEGMVREVARVLRPGGTFIAFRDHVVDSERGLRSFQRNHPLHGLYGGENAFRAREYRGALQAAGLAVEAELGPFDSVINYAPRSAADLRRAITAPLRPRALGGLAERLVRRPLVFRSMTRVASLLYRKPGRLISFVCKKPPG